MTGGTSASLFELLADLDWHTRSRVRDAACEALEAALQVEDWRDRLLTTAVDVAEALQIGRYADTVHALALELWERGYPDDNPTLCPERG